MSLYTPVNNALVTVFVWALFSVTPVFAVEKPMVLSSIRPLALIVEAVAGDLVDSKVLLNHNDSPHHLALRVSQIEKLRDADLLLWVGPDFERFLASSLKNRTKQLALSDFQEAYAQKSGAPDAAHDHGEQHLWLAPFYVRAAAMELVKRLQGLLPEHEANLEQRLNIFVQRMNELEANTRATFKDLDGGFIVYHPALDKYVSAYNLRQVGSVLQGSESSPSVKKIAQLKASAQEADCLIADIQESTAAKRYADLLNLPLFDVDVLAGNDELKTWFDYYTSFADVIFKCTEHVE